MIIKLMVYTRMCVRVCLKSTDTGNQIRNIFEFDVLSSLFYGTRKKGIFCTYDLLRTDKAHNVTQATPF